MKPEHPNKKYGRLASKRAFLLAPRRAFLLARAYLLAASVSILVSSTVASHGVWAQVSPTDEAFDPSDEALKGEGLIGPPRFNQSDSNDVDIECSSSNIESSGANIQSNLWSPSSVPTWSQPAAQQFQEPLSNSRSSWNPIQSTSSSGAPQAVYQDGSNAAAWNLWLKMADQQKQPASPVPEYGAAARIAGFGRGSKPGNAWQGSSMPPGGNAEFVPVPPPQQVASGQWAPPSNGWAAASAQAAPSWTVPPQTAHGISSWPQPMPSGQWGPGPQTAWQAPIPPGVQQVPSNNQTASFSLGASAAQTAQSGGQPPQDAFGGFVNWLWQMPNPFNQGQAAQAGLLQAASSFRIPDMTPRDPNNPLSSPMASMVASAVGSWVTQQMRSNSPFQLGSALPPSMLQPPMPPPSSLPSLFPTDLKMEAKGLSKPSSEENSILDSELADSLLSSNQFPTGSNSGSTTFSSRPTSFRGPLGIPVPGLLGNALANQRNKFAVNYLLNRSLRGSGFGIRLR